MKLKTNKIKEYSKMISLLDGNFVYLDVENKKILCNGMNEFLSINLDDDLIENENCKSMSFDKTEFLHLSEFCNEVEFNNYKYKDSTNSIKGELKHLEVSKMIIDSINEKLNESVDDFEFIFDESNLSEIHRASVFVDPMNINISSQCLNVTENTIFSSSNYRIYVNPTSIKSSCLITSSVLKFINFVGDNFKAYCNSNNEFMIESNDCKLFVNGLDKVEFLPLLGGFQTKYKSLYETTTIKINPKELINKLNFISYYTNNLANSKVTLETKGDEIYLSACDNSIKLEVSEYSSNEEGELDVDLNSSILLKTITSLSTDEDMIISISKDENKKLLLINFKENEEIILSKLKK